MQEPLLKADTRVIINLEENTLIKQILMNEIVYFLIPLPIKMHFTLTTKKRAYIRFAPMIHNLIY